MPRAALRTRIPTQGAHVAPASYKSLRVGHCAKSLRDGHLAGTHPPPARPPAAAAAARAAPAAHAARRRPTARRPGARASRRPRPRACSSSPRAAAPAAARAGPPARLCRARSSRGRHRRLINRRSGICTPHAAEQGRAPGCEAVVGAREAGSAPATRAPRRALCGPALPEVRMRARTPWGCSGGRGQRRGVGEARARSAPVAGKLAWSARSACRGDAAQLRLSPSLSTRRPGSCARRRRLGASGRGRGGRWNSG